MSKPIRLTRDDLVARGTPPEQCGPAIPVAPARGELRAFMPVELVTGADGEERLVDAGYRGRSAARVRDVWDRMESARRGKRSVPLFTPGQVEMGRYYATLTERLAASGVRGISLETLSQGAGGGDDDWITSVIRDSDTLAGLHRKIGDGWALSVRRVRPSARGERRAVSVRTLVDAVCLGDCSLEIVIKSAGWQATGRSRAMVRDALADALDRMIGYRVKNPVDR